MLGRLRCRKPTSCLPTCQSPEAADLRMFFDLAKSEVYYVVFGLLGALPLCFGPPGAHFQIRALESL
jgi:hypothetical protein